MIALFLLISCHSVNLKEDLIDAKINCYLKGKDVFITFINNNNAPLLIKRPCMANAYVDIRHNDKSLPIKIRIKVDPNCMLPAYQLKAKDSVTFKYNYKIDDLYDLEKNNKYDMFIEYYIYENNRLKQKIFSDKYSFVN